MSGTIVSYAQNFEDIVLNRALLGVEAGTYIDVGAADPTHDSVTKLFYDRGWSGINIEPVPSLAADLRSQRPRDVTLECAVGSNQGSLTLYEVPSTGLSSAVTQFVEGASLTHGGYVERVVPVQTLNSILGEHLSEGREIHFLKIDVEGYEREVLASLDFRKWRPWIVVVEATEPNSTQRTDHQWRDLLENVGYHATLFDGLNLFFVCDEHRELADKLSYPACVFDHPFINKPHKDLLDTYEYTRKSYEDLQALYEKSITDYLDLDGKLRQALAEIERITKIYEQAITDWQHLDDLYQNLLEDNTNLRSMVEDGDQVIAQLRESVKSLQASLPRRLWRRIRLVTGR